MALLRESSLERLPRDVRHREDAGGDVRAVDAGLGIECGTVQRVNSRPGRRVGEGESLSKEEVLVLERLDAEEGDAEEQGREEEEPEFRLVAAFDGGQRLDHGQAAADQDEGVESRQRYVEDLVRGRLRTLEGRRADCGGPQA